MSCLRNHLQHFSKMENCTADLYGIFTNTSKCDQFLVKLSDLGEYYSEPYRTLSIVVDSIIMFPIAFGNILLILSIIRFRHLHNIHYYLVLNLAISDTFVGMILLPNDIYTLVLPQSSQQKTTCLLRFAFHMVSWSSSVSGLFLISAERYIAIKHPFRYPTLVTPGRTFVTVVIIWMLNIIISFTPLLGANTWTPGAVCVPSNIWNMAYGCVTAFSLFPLILVTFFMYASVIKTTWCHMKVVNTQINVVSVMTTSENGEIKRNDELPNIHKAKIMALIFGIFLLCWLPFCAVLMAQRVLYRNKKLAKAKVYLLSLLKINSLLNFLVYFTRSVVLRNAIQRLIFCKCRKR